jgi:hypothetical protein
MIERLTSAVRKLELGRVSRYPAVVALSKRTIGYFRGAPAATVIDVVMFAVDNVVLSRRLIGKVRQG